MEVSYLFEGILERSEIRMWANKEKQKYSLYHVLKELNDKRRSAETKCTQHFSYENKNNVVYRKLCIIGKENKTSIFID